MCEGKLPSVIFRGFASRKAKEARQMANYRLVMGEGDTVNTHIYSKHVQLYMNEKD